MAVSSPLSRRKKLGLTPADADDRREKAIGHLVTEFGRIRGETQQLSRASDIVGHSTFLKLWNTLTEGDAEYGKGKDMFSRRLKEKQSMAGEVARRINAARRGQRVGGM